MLGPIATAAREFWKRVFVEAGVLLIIIRALFILFAAGLALYLGSELEGIVNQVLVFALTILSMLFVIGLDAAFRQKQIATISAIFFGLVVGVVLANLLLVALTPIISSLPQEQPATAGEEVMTPERWNTVLYLLSIPVLCYLCISVLLQTKDDFRFVIPYVEFAREVKALRPLVLDTSVIIDGRIADVCQTKIIDSTMIVPRFVLQELQSIADSSDKQRRNRGRRGLDVLNRLRSNEAVDVELHDGEVPGLEGKPVDQRLVLLAKHLGGKVVTNDFNLNKVARVQGVEVVNLNELANALKPVFLPGESMSVRLTKQGEEAGQGVGYLDDGTMVVVEHGRESIGKEVKIQVTSVLQTSAGRMIFGKLAG